MSDRGPTRTVTARWTIQVLLDERDGRKQAEARLHTSDHTDLVGTGDARLVARAQEVPEIGEDLAAAGALLDLALQLLEAAAAEIEHMTGQPVLDH